jgi:hypothetical protein
LIECSLFTFLSDVVWNNEALDCSLDLVVSHSSINMEQILVRMNGVSEDVLQEEASSQFSLLIELSIIWNIASVKLNTSSVAITRVLSHQLVKGETSLNHHVRIELCSLCQLATLM